MDVVPQNVHWLIPEENSPCDIFLHFRGQFPQALQAGQPVTISILEKLAKAKCSHIYIRKSDLKQWELWASQRHAIAKGMLTSDSQAKEDLFGNKRAEITSYLQRVFQKRSEEDPELENAIRKAKSQFQKVVNSPMLDWYFHRFHEPPVLFHHNARVAFTSTVFSLLHGLVDEKVAEAMIFSAMIHELEGDPSSSMKTVASQATLQALEKAKHPVPSEVIRQIELQDELCSGRGFPNNRKLEELPLSARIFTYFNHFDHYRLKEGISRRAKLEYAKQQMAQRKHDYDPALWETFWEFWEKRAELLA